MKKENDYLKTLNRKRSGSGALILNEDNKVLMLKPTYKEYYEIPGGVVEKNESPKACCQREIFEEIGLKLNIEKLLVLEYQKLEFDDSFMFLFSVEKIKTSDIIKENLPENEIEDYGFYTTEEIKDLTVERLYLRIKKALIALKTGEAEYYETFT